MSGPTKRYWNDDSYRSDTYDLTSKIKRTMRLDSASTRQAKYIPLGTSKRIEATTDTGHHVIATHYSGDSDVVQVFIYSPDNQRLIVCDNNVPTGELDKFIADHTAE